MARKRKDQDPEETTETSDDETSNDETTDTAGADVSGGTDPDETNKDPTQQPPNPNQAQLNQVESPKEPELPKRQLAGTYRCKCRVSHGNKVHAPGTMLVLSDQEARHYLKSDAVEATD